MNDVRTSTWAAPDKLSTSSIDAESYELEGDHHVPLNHVWSTWLCGDHLVSERHEVRVYSKTDRDC
ncbi:hypothetical protein [Streptomyces sp. NPDC006285]|uniref:hypothetical protein n=1 Tax=Streptomyces sp. NPDC006285 TaxID=3364742 RepID=UPI00368482B1